MLKKAGDETVAKELTLITGHAQMVFDVGGGFLKVERGELITNGKALVEGEVRGEGEFVGQVGLAQEDEGELGGGVEIFVEQETELVEDVGRQLVSLIEDKEEEAAFAGQIEQGVVELSLKATERESGMDFESEEDLGIEGGRVEVRIGQVGQGIEVTVEGMSEGSQSSRLAGADVTGDERG